MAAEIYPPILISNQAWNFALLHERWLAGQKISTFETTPVGIHCFHSNVVTDRGSLRNSRGISKQRGATTRRMVGCCVTKDRALFEIGHGSARRHHISTAGARKCVISSVQYLVGKFWRCLREGWRENFQLNHETCTMFAPREINSSLD